MASKNDIFDVLGNQLLKNIEMFSSLKPEQQENMKKAMENHLQGNLYILEKMLETHDLPPEFHELYFELEHFLKRSIAYSNPLNANNYKGGRRGKTRKMRGGARTPSRTVPALGAAGAATGRPMTSAEVADVARSAATIAEAGVTYHRAQANLANISRKNTFKTADHYVRFAEWSFKRIGSLVAVAIAGVWGSQSASAVVGTSAYYSAAGIHAGQVAINKATFGLIGESSIGYNAIPESVMPILLDYSFDIDTSIAASMLPKDESVIEINWNSMFEADSAEFSSTLTNVMRSPIVTTNWDRISEGIEAEGREKSAALNTCKAEKGTWQVGFPWVRPLDPCKAEKSALELFTPTLEKVRNIGKRIAPASGEIKPTAGRLISTVSNMVSGIADALKMEGEENMADVTMLREMLKVFNGVDGLGLQPDKGRFKYELLANPGDVAAAKVHTRDILAEITKSVPAASGAGTESSIVHKVQHLLDSVVDLTVTNYAQNAAQMRKRADMGNEYMKALETILSSRTAGVDKLIDMFDLRISTAKDDGMKDIYGRIIQNIREADLANVRFPSDKARILQIASEYENHYMRYTRAKKTVPLESTLKFEWMRISRTYAGSEKIVIMGGFAGVVIATLLGGTAFVLYNLGTKTLLGPLYVAAFPALVAKDACDAILERGNRRQLGAGIDRRIANGELDPREAAVMKAAIFGETLPPLPPVYSALPPAPAPGGYPALPAAPAPGGYPALPAAPTAAQPPLALPNGTAAAAQRPLALKNRTVAGAAARRPLALPNGTAGNAAAAQRPLALTNGNVAGEAAGAAAGAAGAASGANVIPHIGTGLPSSWPHSTNHSGGRRSRKSHPKKR